MKAQERTTGNNGAADVIIVGGGITGLTLAYKLHQRCPNAVVTLLEAEDTLGGKIQRSPIGANHYIDTGPDAFMATNPRVRALLEELEITSELVSPLQNTTGILNGKTLRPIPSGLIQGVPVSPRAVLKDHLLTVRGALRASLDVLLPQSKYSNNTTVAEMIASRVGKEVVRKLVDPLVGGIYAGDTELMVANDVIPQIATVLRENRSLILGLRRLPKVARGGGLMTFAGNGMSRLPEALNRLLKGDVEIRTNQRVTSIAPKLGGELWHVRTDDAQLSAKVLVVTTPNYISAELVSELDSAVSADLAKTAYASVMTVTLLCEASERESMVIPGFVIPQSENELITAMTCLSDRWEFHRLNGKVLIRCSLGRYGDLRAFQMSDEEITERTYNDVQRLMHIHGNLIDAVVKRWDRALPQHNVGTGLSSSSFQKLELQQLYFAGAAFGGVGVASCIEQAIDTAQRVAEQFDPLAVPLTLQV